MTQSNEITGGEAMARMLRAFNAGPMFGMGGFQLLAFYDAARRLKLNHHLINDERCGIFAADAYAKVSGRVGLVDATLGPGATNLVTGLIESLNAGSPIVARPATASTTPRRPGTSISSAASSCWRCSRGWPISTRSPDCSSCSPVSSANERPIGWSMARR